MISAVDFEDIFGWSPARARTGLPTGPSQPSAVSSATTESAIEAPAPSYTIRELRPQRRDVRTREYASVNG